MTKEEAKRIKVGSIIHYHRQGSVEPTDKLLVVGVVSDKKVTVKWDKYSDFYYFLLSGRYLENHIIASDPTPTTLQWVDEVLNGRK